MGTSELYQCKELKSMKDILEVLELLWDELDFTPMGVTINSIKGFTSITLEVEDIALVKGLVEETTELTHTSHDIWMHDPKWIHPKVRESNVKIALYCYKRFFRKVSTFKEFLS